ncbi:PPE family protein [Mycobacterium simiae]|uniref:PPE family protein n=1 Tax=Mycobacterium simiae TaxID=1784 RepID=UPI00165FCBAD|nr:PPE family protein [Mycobacterium simiae]
MRQSTKLISRKSGTAMDYGLFPPEVNSARMCTGPGARSLHAAAANWDEMAATLHDAATSYRAVIVNLALAWQGPSAAAMASAATPLVAWFEVTAAQAEHAATNARLFAMAYETAYIMTVPLAEVLANRFQLMVLTATNVFGQNTPAIMHNEAVHLEMWAQDAAAMYAYAAEAATATRLTPFTPPRPTTSAAEVASHFAARAIGSSHAAGEIRHDLTKLYELAPSALRELMSPSRSGTWPKVWTAVTDTTKVMRNTTTWGLLSSKIAYEPIRFSLFATKSGGMTQPLTARAFAKGAAEGVAAAANHMVPVGPPARPVWAAMGSANALGKLSVPPSWTETAPGIVPDAETLTSVATAADTDSQTPWVQMALSSLAGTGVGSVAPKARARFVPRTPAGG